jgi:hypothetical protein
MKKPFKNLITYATSVQVRAYSSTICMAQSNLVRQFLEVPRIGPPPCGLFSDLRVGSQYKIHAVLNTSAQNPKIGINLDIFIE